MELVHWNYYLILEDDLLRLSRFIEFSKNNFKTYSIELAHLLLASTSEIDVVLKMVCKPFNPKARNEKQYRSCILKNIPAFTKIKVFMNKHDLTFQPWHSWNKKKTPTWWTAYNKVKHTRNEYYERASLRNVLYSMAGLLVTNLYLYKDIANQGDLSPWSKCFLLENKYIKGISPAQEGWALNTNL